MILLLKSKVRDPCSFVSLMYASYIQLASADKHKFCVIFKNYFGSAKTSKEDVISLFYVFQNLVDFFCSMGSR